MRRLFAHSQRKITAGFTLVELLVTISIFAVVTGIVLVSQSRFNNTILLTDLTYDVALTIRQAQNYGVNVRQYESGNTKNFSTAYGVYFNENYLKNLALFADADGNNAFTSDSSGSALDVSDFCISNPGECIDRYTIRRGNAIDSFCVYTTANARQCSGDVENAKLYILFRRPQPDARFYFTYDVDQVLSSDIAKAEITLKASDGSTRKVEVNTTGQISVVR